MLDSTSLIGRVLVQNSGVAQLKVTSVVSVNRDVALVKATNLNTSKKGQLKVDLRTGKEYLWSKDNPFAFTLV